MIYGYCRVSTKGQERYGTSLEEQKRKILCSYPGARVVTEAYSGAKERPLFDDLCEKLQRGSGFCLSKAEAKKDL